LHSVPHLLITFRVNAAPKGIADIGVHRAHHEHVASDPFICVEGGSVFCQADEAVFAGCICSTYSPVSMLWRGSV
jgi:hypothetical protein